MRTRTLGLVLGFGLATGLATASPVEPPQKDSVRLRYEWQTGTTLYYRTISTSEMKMVENGTGKERVLHTRSAQIDRMEVYSVRDDGTGRVAVTTIRVRRESDDPTKGKTVFDSAQPKDPKDDRDSQLYGSLVNRTLILEITPEGRMLHIQGLDELFDSMQTEAGPEAGKVLDFFKRGVTESLETDVISEVFSSAEAHSVGDQWSTHKAVRMPMLGEVLHEGTNKLEAIDLIAGHRVARVSSETKFSSKPTDRPKPPKESDPLTGEGIASLMAIAIPQDMAGGSTTVEMFDLDRGRLIRRETRGSRTGRTLDSEILGRKMPGWAMMATDSTTKELIGPEDPIDPQNEPVRPK